MFSNNNDQILKKKVMMNMLFINWCFVGYAAAITLTIYKVRKPCRTSSHIGYKFVMDVMNGHEIRCFEKFRMEKHVFMNLLETLTKRCGLKEGLMCP